MATFKHISSKNADYGAVLVGDCVEVFVEDLGILEQSLRLSQSSYEIRILEVACACVSAAGASAAGVSAAGAGVALSPPQPAMVITIAVVSKTLTIFFILNPPF